jgi:TM2 domain-containing membrane protein YozV
MYFLTDGLIMVDRTSIDDVPMAELPIALAQKFIPLLLRLGFYISLAVTMFIVFSRLSRAKIENIAAPKTYLYATATFSTGLGLVGVYFFPYAYFSSPSIEQTVYVLRILVLVLSSFAVAFVFVLLGASRSNSIKRVFMMAAAVVLLSALMASMLLVDGMLTLYWGLNRLNFFTQFISILTQMGLAWVLFQLGTSNANLVSEHQGKDVLGSIMQHEIEASKNASAPRSENRYCRHCGAGVRADAVACTSCGMNPRVGSQYCPECSVETKVGQVLCLKCGVSLGGVSSDKSKVAAGVLAILLGPLGIHKFYLGYSTAGVITLVVSIIGSFVLVGPLIMSVIGIIEGIIYLTKSDQEFDRLYVSNKKEWF